MQETATAAHQTQQARLNLAERREVSLYRLHGWRPKGRSQRRGLVPALTAMIMLALAGAGVVVGALLVAADLIDTWARALLIDR